MQINTWLEKFRKAWIEHDITSTMTLFTEDVEYWETPFKKLGSLAEVRREWQGVTSQHDIELETLLFSEQGSKYAILWRLSYRSDTGVRRQLAGTYLVELDASGLCTYFLSHGRTSTVGLCTC